MKKLIFPAGNRLAVHFPTLLPTVPRKQIENYLQKNNMLLTKVNIIDLAHSQIGKDYKRGFSGANNSEQFDCSGLIQWLYGQVGIYIPRISIDQKDYGIPVSPIKIKPGDLLFSAGNINYFWENEEENGIGHVGIFTGKNVIHAANKERGVVKDSLSHFLDNDFRGAVRIHKRLSEIETIIMPLSKENPVQYDLHLRWRILSSL